MKSWYGICEWCNEVVETKSGGCGECRTSDCVEELDKDDKGEYIFPDEGGDTCTAQQEADEYKQAQDQAHKEWSKR